ncbi:MAG: UDP-N-acetyl-D-glucosamine dehydrogenase [Theionarchaea archaeon DG-70]|nr:MAG: UDP-N-acetyl-D-glucosamine dehydrogenase [Theionarchaea archaeon DG-70]
MKLDMKIRNKSCKVGVIGLGYVGLPLAVEFAENDYAVIGIDISEENVQQINQGKSYVGDISSKRLAKLAKKRRIVATSDYDALKECDAAIICVPTPFTPSKDPDISYIVAASEGILKRLHKGQLIILKSTTYPETTEKVVLPILARSGLKVGKDFYLSFSPERIDPGNKIYTTKNTPMVVGGVTSECTRLTEMLFGRICDTVVAVSSPRVAEMSKLLENIFRSVNIALVNELACLCERMGNIDIWEVIEAASTKPFGFMPFYPGPGIGGHCILVDPYYLSWKAREYDFHTNFIELAAETNESMPYYVAHKVIEALSETGICASKAKILILGVAFKRDIADTRNSPAIKVMEILQDKVAHIDYNDPYVPEIYLNRVRRTSTELTVAILRKTHCVAITTDHSVYDYEWLAENAKMIVDARNAVKGTDRMKADLFKLGRRRGRSTE